MKFSAEQKQHIVSQCSAAGENMSLRALSRQYGLSSKGSTLSRWMRRYDGSAASLKDKQRSGRPRILTQQEVHNHIREPIISHNRKHTPINYKQIHTLIRQRTQKRPSLQTVRRYGLEIVNAKQRRVRRRTSTERKCICIVTVFIACTFTQKNRVSNRYVIFCTPCSFLSALQRNSTDANEAATNQQAQTPVP